MKQSATSFPDVLRRNDAKNVDEAPSYNAKDTKVVRLSNV